MAIDHRNEIPHHQDVAYEQSDLGHRGILTFFVFLTVAALVIMLAMYAMYRGFGVVADKMQPETSPLVKSQGVTSEGLIHNIAKVSVQKFPEPRLQSDEPSDMSHFREYEERVLTAQPWTGPNGVVHVPIDLAMKALAQKGLASRANPVDPSAANPMMVPTEAGFTGHHATRALQEPVPSEEAKPAAVEKQEK